MLPIAVLQPGMPWLIHCYREQAPSHTQVFISLEYQDFLACWYSGITFGMAACSEAIRLSEAG